MQARTTHGDKNKLTYGLLDLFSTNDYEMYNYKLHEH